MPTMLSLFSRHHSQSPATSPALLLVATMLSTSAVHPPSPFSLSSRSCWPTATTLPPPLSLSSLRSLHIRSLSLHLGIVDCCRLLSLTSIVGFFLHHGRYRCRLLSLSSLLLFLRLSNVLLWVISASARTSMASKLITLDPLPLLLRSLPLSPLASAPAPSSLIDATTVASFTAASPPPTKTSCRHRLPYSSSTDVVAASLFLHNNPSNIFQKMKKIKK